MPGVRAVLTHEDVPGRPVYGMEIADQPVLAIDEVRYQGEPVAIVAADHPETARRAAARIEVDYAPMDALTDAPAALADGARDLHPGGNLLRAVPIRHGDPGATADVVVRGVYEVGMQDQAFLGPRVGAGGAGGGRRHRPLHRHPVAPRQPGPGGGEPRAPAGADAAPPVRRRRGVRRPRGPVDAGPRRDARAAHGAAR